MKKFAALIVLAALAVNAENLVPNGSFEEGVKDWRYFSMKGEVELLDRSTQVREGDEAVTMQINSADTEKLISGKYGAWGRLHKEIPVTAGKTYRFSAYAYPDKGFDGQMSVLVTAGSGSGTKQSFGQGQAYGKWQEISGEFVPTVDKCMIFLNVMGGKGEVSFDDVELVEVVPDTALLKNGNFQRGTASWGFSVPDGKVDGKVTAGKAFAMKILEAPEAKPAWARIYQTVELPAAKKYDFSVRAMTSEDFTGNLAIWIKDAKTGANLRVFNAGPTKGEWKKFKGDFTTSVTGKVVVYLNMTGKSGTASYSEATIAEKE